MIRILAPLPFFFCAMPCSAQANVFKASAYGAVNDGKTLNTKAIQSAIDDCTKAGGGTVLLDGGGQYLSGTIRLKDNVTLRIENGTTLLGSPDYKDYHKNTHKNMYKMEPYMNRCFIYAEDASSIAIVGQGTIDGNGHKRNFDKERPMMIRFLRCKNIRIKNVSLINPAAWTSAWLYCDDIVVEGINNHARVNDNGDGLDFDGCRNVRVSNCNFSNSDDCICLQASRKDRPCENITVSNCTFSTKWGGIRNGLLSRGDFNSVTVTNCTFRDIKDAGLKIQMNEGGTMKNMTFSNLVMQNVPRPIFMTLTQQRACVDAPKELPPMGKMSGFIFQNIIVDNQELDENTAFFLTGMPGAYIEDVTIDNVLFTVPGGGEAALAEKEVKEYTPEVLGDWWPEFYLVGTLPAYGLYARHMKNLKVQDFSIKLAGKDERPAILTNDVLESSFQDNTSNGQAISKHDTTIVSPKKHQLNH